MNTALGTRGWKQISVCGLPLSYAKELPVTPYFHCSEISLKPFGKYAIEGVIGVLHDHFESLWKLRADRQPITPGFGVVLNVVNYPELRKQRYVDLDHIDQQIRDFCATVADLLKLAGMPLCSFAGYAYRTKFDAFGQFVQQLQGTRSA